MRVPPTRLTSTKRAANHIHFLMDETGGKSIIRMWSRSIVWITSQSCWVILFQGINLTNLTLTYSSTSPALKRKVMVFVSSLHHLNLKMLSLLYLGIRPADRMIILSRFLKATWSNMYRNFSQSGSLLKQWNATTTMLIPKITNASSTTYFRIISCLNTIYKVIFKLIASRLKLSYHMSFLSLNQHLCHADY